MSKLAQIKALRKGKGIQYLLDTAYEIFRNPIAMFDTNYALIAYTDVVSDDPLWNELISTGTFSMKTQKFFAEEYFTDDVVNANKLAILKSEHLKYDRIFGHIFNKDHIKVANIVIVGCDTAFGAEVTVAFEKLADKISREIANDKYYTAYGRAYHEAIINKLLDRIITDTKVYAPHVQIIYDSFEDYLFLAVVDVCQNDTHSNKLPYFKSLLENKYRSFKYAVHADYIVIIMSSKHKYFYKDRFFDKHNNPFELNNLYVGISSSFENLYELHKYYDEAVAALQKGVAGDSGQRIFLYNETPL